MTEHPSYSGRLSRAAKAAAERPAGEPAAIYTPSRRYADRACCCPASPTVIAMIPTAKGGGAATDLLLCGHHYRASRTALAAAGASILDMRGCPLSEEEWPDPT